MNPRIAGIDEAGRGPLAGPVVVAAVVFDPAQPRINGLDDSKALTAKRRELLYPRIIERALAYRIVFIEADEIDRRNIFQATLHGMREALLGVVHVADTARIDGNKLPPGLPCPAEAWIGGDARCRFFFFSLRGCRRGVAHLHLVHAGIEAKIVGRREVSLIGFRRILII